MMNTQREDQEQLEWLKAYQQKQWKKKFHWWLFKGYMKAAVDELRLWFKMFWC